MTIRRARLGNETAAARPAQSSMSAETIAAGTTAGALMLGVVQAEAARSDAALEAAPPAFDADDPLAALLTSGDITMATAPDAVAMPAGTSVAAAPINDPAISTPPADGASATTPILPASFEDAVAEGAGHAGASPETAPAADIEAIAARISDQVVSAIGQIADGIQADQFATELGQSIAAEIADTAVSIARDMNVASTVDGGLARIAGSVPTLDAISGSLPSIETIADQLATLPADMLGAETFNDLGGGMLSDLFYSDGGAPSPAALLPTAADLTGSIPAAPDLSEAASSFVEGATAPVTDLIGLSYIDAPDTPYSGMQSSLGALHVI
ncbi:MAG: hypothetical protein IBJ07_16250 [Rhizobiaceae bacterium]|nr:hypothetical protein [Rhizobiaceae bacterium]